MSKKSQEENRENSWNQAIQDVEAKLGRLSGMDAGNEERRLRAAIGTFKAHRDAGFEWPGRRKAGMERTPIPA